MAAGPPVNLLGVGGCHTVFHVIDDRPRLQSVPEEHLQHGTWCKVICAICHSLLPEERSNSP